MRAAEHSEAQHRTRDTGGQPVAGPEAAAGGLTFGPVPSRRLGNSLGVNNIPPKVCSYSCIYCQVGRTTRLSTERKPFHAPRAIIGSVARGLETARRLGDPVDYVTFVSDGEPTLDIHLGEEIRGIAELGVRVAVITNATLLWRADVSEDLRAADWVSAKVDTVDENAWRRVNRPARDIELGRVLDGIAAFASRYTGVLATETMLLAGLTDDDRSLEATAGFLARIRPSVAYLSAPIRPPAERSVVMPGATVLSHALQVFARAGLTVRLLSEDEASDFPAADGVEQELLAVIAVHPMREVALRRYLARSGADWSLVVRLLDAGAMIALDHRGQRFYALPTGRGRARGVSAG